MKNPHTNENKRSKGVLITCIILSLLAVAALAAAVAGDIAGFTVLYEKGSASKIVKHAILCLLALTLISVPAVIKRFGFIVPPAPQILFACFIFLHFIAGEMLRMYDHPILWGLKTRIFDKLVHVLTGALFFMLGLSLAKLLNKDKDIFQLSPFWVTLFAVCFSLFINCLWEFMEFFYDALTASNMQRWQDGFTSVLTESGIRLAEFYGQCYGLIDTMGDLLGAAAGALSAAIPAFILLKKKNSKAYHMLITKVQ